MKTFLVVELLLVLLLQLVLIHDSALLTIMLKTDPSKTSGIKSPFLRPFNCLMQTSIQTHLSFGNLHFEMQFASGRNNTVHTSQTENKSPYELVTGSYKQHETTPSMDQSTDPHAAKTESNQIKTESTEDFPPSHMLNQLHLNDALQPSDSDTESDLDANETEITPDNDQFGYNHIIAQVSDDQFLVTWPDTYNITQEAYDARLNTEPVPYTSSWVHQRANGNLNAGWHDTIEPRDALDSTHIETFISSNPAHK